MKHGSEVAPEATARCLATVLTKYLVTHVTLVMHGDSLTPRCLFAVLTKPQTHARSQWKYTDGYGEILWKQLPEGSRAWELKPGAAFGGGVGLPLNKWGGGGGGVEGRCVQVVCSPGNAQQCVLLSLDRSQMQTIADMALGKFAEKAQVLFHI